jgi:NO-binding membrane sensor protein with MHYT domain
MLADFFQLGPLPLDQMTGTFDLRLVLLSYVVAFLASYVALDVAGRLRDLNNTPLSKKLWIVGGALAMGAGIWSMHFIGMLAFTMPGMHMSYELSWTALSLFVAILASAFALYLLSVREINVAHLAFGGIFLGFGIACMHYLGMRGMQGSMNIHYLPGLFILSIVIAIAASEAALWFALKSNQVVATLRVRLKVISALIMGAAIAGMHYTGMFAAVFTPLSHPETIGSDVSPSILATAVAVVTCVVMGVAFFLSAKKEAMNEQMLRNARQAGMAEVAIAVLHNVGNVLNSVNVSANLIAEKIVQSKLSMLTGLSEMLAAHKNDLGEFLQNDTKGKQIPEFLQQLSLYWKDEQQQITHETQILLKNLHHIKEIITMQQNLSKKVEADQITALDTVLKEAILICSIDRTRHHIDIETDIVKLKAIVVDRVKLLQILVNLIQNAKDVLRHATQEHKTIQVRCGLENPQTVFVQVIDNGAGISAANLKKIFTHGFTTKVDGHGFGLHASALAAKEMGGSMRVASEGEGKGAKFTLLLPYRIPKK